MTSLTAEQIAQYAANAGWTGQDLDTAVAVALAESGGDAGTIGDVSLQNATYGPSVGLWQIRSINADHANAFERAHMDYQSNFDPQTNANNAYAIQQQFGWRRWSTYSQAPHKYQQFLPEARRAVQSLNNGSQTTTPTDQLQQQTPTQQTPQQNGQGSSNSQGFLGEIEKLMESVGKLLNPADKLSKASQAAQRAAANGQAFGKVSGSSQAHQTHVSNTQKYSQHASKGSERVKTHSDDIKCTADDYQTFSNQNAEKIDSTAAPVRTDMIQSVPSNWA